MLDNLTRESAQIESIVRDEAQAFKDSYGIISDKRGEICGNGLRYTSEHYITLYRCGYIKSFDTKNFNTMIRATQVEKGLLRRHPNRQDQQSFDDYIAVCSASAVLNKTIAKEVLDYGRTHYFNYNNVKPGKITKHSFLARNLSFIAHLYYSAGEKPPIPLRIVFLISIIYTALFGKGQDDWMLSFHQLNSYHASGHRGAFGIIATEFWLKKFREKNPFGIRKLLCDYFGFWHPIAKHFV